MLKFAPPTIDPASFQDSDLGDLGGLVQSLRWFVSRSSLLIYFWSMHSAVEAEAQSPRSARPLPPHATYMLRRALLHSVILEIRALHDRNPKSLGSRQLADKLNLVSARADFNQFLTKNPHQRMMEDETRRDAYLDYVKRYAEIMSASDGKSTIQHHPLSSKTQLIRRMANKAVAHSTLDDYELGGNDIGDVVLGSLTIACAIEAAVGDVAISNDLARVETSGFEAAAMLLHTQVDSEPHQINMIRGFLPTWVSSGIEFPNYPADFEAKKPKEENG